MNYLGIDYGEKRIGLSCGDSDVRLAVPLAAAVEPLFPARMEHIAEEIRSRRIGELVVGYPYNMDGTIGFKAKEVDAFIEKLEAQFGLPVHRTDERLTSSDAQARMNEAGRGQRSRSKQTIRAKLAERKSGVLDSRAAALILQDYLDALAGAGGALLFAEGDEGEPWEEDGGNWSDGDGGVGDYSHSHGDDDGWPDNAGELSGGDAESGNGDDVHTGYGDDRRGGSGFGNRNGVYDNDGGDDDGNGGKSKRRRKGGRR